VSALLPEGWSVRPVTLDDVATILAVVHASDIAAVGEPDFTADEVVAILTAPGHDPARDSWLAFDPAGRAGGWAYVENHSRGRHETLEVYVHPEFGPPAQGPLLDVALDRVAERAGEHGHATVTARAGLVAAETHYAGLLRAAGFAFVKRYARMTRPLDPSLTRPAVPDGVVLRTLRPGDEDDIAATYAVISAAFVDLPDGLRSTYEAYRAALAVQPSVAWDEWFLVEVDGVAVATLTSSDRVVEENESWVHHLAVLAPHRGRGLGALLLRTAFATYAAKGRTRAGLAVDLTNPTSAYRLYTGVGLTPAYEVDIYEREVVAAVSVAS
jgi:GNAT superfamily N-acetyltransferase